MRGKGLTFRCRVCGHVFSPKPTPIRTTLVKCPKCGSDDIEFVQ